MTADLSLLSGAWVCAGLTICLYSFLYRDNPLFKIAEHLYLGAGMGWLFQLTLFNVWKLKIFEPLAGGDMSPVLPALLGLSLVAQRWRRFAWISRYGFAFLMGYGAGLAIPTSIASNFMAQLQGTIEPFLPGSAAYSSFTALFNAVFLAAGFLCVLSRFFFTFGKGGMGKASAAGGYILMLYFGASFGSAVAGRFSMLYGRFAQLHEYSGPQYLYAVPVLLLGAALFFLYPRLRAGSSKKTGRAS